MNKIIIGIITILISTSTLFADENELVNKAFESYRKAILNGDAESAYDLINSKTKDYYDQMLKNALHTSAEESKKLSTMNKVFLIQTRHRIPKEEVIKFDNAAYFKYAVKKGWIGKDSVSSLGITDIKVNGDLATSKIKTGDKVAPFGFSFDKENGQWKIDLTSTLAISNSAFQQQIKNSGRGEDEVIFEMVESVSGKKVDQSVWEPIIKK